MSYVFRVWFSGIVHFVENKDPNARCQLCVVLPRAEKGPRRHQGVIYEASREIRCGKPRLKAGARLADLSCPHRGRRRISFRLTREDDLPPQPRWGLSFPEGFLHLDEIVGFFSDENDRIVRADPPPEVLSQILFEGPCFLSYDNNISVLRDWIMPGTLTGGERLVPVADPVFVDIPAIEKVELIDAPMDYAGPADYKSLRPNADGFIEIFVSHRCEGGFLSGCHLTKDDLDLRFYPGNNLSLMQIDTDFEFTYQLLHPTTLEAITKVLPKKNVQQAGSPPRFPLPESSLIDIRLAPHLCLPFLPTAMTELAVDGKTKEAKEAKQDTGDQNDPAARSGHSTGNDFDSLLHKLETLLPLDRRIEFVIRLLKEIFGTGTGSGNDCLSSKGAARFVSLETYIPAPLPAVSLASVHSLAKALRRVSFPEVPEPGKEKETSPKTAPPEKAGSS